MCQVVRNIRLHEQQLVRTIYCRQDILVLLQRSDILFVLCFAMGLDSRCRGRGTAGCSDQRKRHFLVSDPTHTKRLSSYCRVIFGWSRCSGTVSLAAGFLTPGFGGFERFPTGLVSVITFTAEITSKRLTPSLFLR